MMKKILILTILFVAGCGVMAFPDKDGNYPDWSFAGERQARVRLIRSLVESDAQMNDLNYHSEGLEIDAYGPGIHMNQYGQPVTLKPDFGGVPGERLQIKENAYGLGVHMDQYGRPVREYPWPKK